MPPRQRATGAPPVKGPMAVMRGGVKDGWCYYVTDLQEAQRAAEHLGTPYLYEPTDEREPWALDDNHQCQVWKYTGPDTPAPATPKKRATRARKPPP